MNHVSRRGLPSIVKGRDDGKMVRGPLQSLPVEGTRSPRLGGDGCGAVDIDTDAIRAQPALLEQTTRADDLVEHLVAFGNTSPAGVEVMKNVPRFSGSRNRQGAL